MNLPGLKITLRSFELKSLNQAYDQIKIIANNYNNKSAQIVKCETEMSLGGLVPIPSKKRWWCLLTSPHVDKKAREHLSATKHTRIFHLRLIDSNKKNNFDYFDELLKELELLDIPEGTWVKMEYMMSTE